jgi:hypothetical protein
MNSYYGTVNGPACHYAKLVRYNKCSLVEESVAPQPVTKSGATGASSESFKYRESFTGATGSVADYTPTYKVPNYPPINTDALTHGVSYNCGGYFNIMDAYGSTAGNCVTNFINN